MPRNTRTARRLDMLAPRPARAARVTLRGGARRFMPAPRMMIDYQNFQSSPAAFAARGAPAHRPDKRDLHPPRHDREKESGAKNTRRAGFRSRRKRRRGRGARRGQKGSDVIERLKRRGVPSQTVYRGAKHAPPCSTDRPSPLTSPIDRPVDSDVELNYGRPTPSGCPRRRSKAR